SKWDFSDLGLGLFHMGFGFGWGVNANMYSPWGKAKITMIDLIQVSVMHLAIYDVFDVQESPSMFKIV
ncbi:898_t:CDS:1, partial [Gigaspora margarita]